MKTVRVKGLKEYRVKGKLYRYHRLSNVPIDPKLSGAALAAEVARLDRIHKPLAQQAGTLRILAQKYKVNSQHWERLGKHTRAHYEEVFKWLGAAMDKPIVGFTPPVIAGLRDKLKKSSGFKMANQLLVTLDAVFQYGVEYGDAEMNPVVGITRVARPLDLPDANRPWSTSEVATALRLLPMHVRGPVALAAYLAPREGDVIAMPTTALKNGVLTFTTSKTNRYLELPVPDDLAELLEAYAQWRAALFKEKKKEDNVATLFVTSRGSPWTIDGFKTSFGKQRDELVEAKHIGAGATFHGLRHTVATILAESGFEDAATKHLLGHGKETMTEHYSRRAKRRDLLTSMTNTVQQAYRNRGENVIQMDRSRNEIV